MEIKPGIGFSSLSFGNSMKVAEKLFGKAEEELELNDIEEWNSTVWHYWQKGFSLFFDNKQRHNFSCAEIENESAVLWEQKIFVLKETEIISLFKSKGIKNYEVEIHEWGEKRISFDEVNIDFYFIKNKLISINYGQLTNIQPILILPN